MQLSAIFRTAYKKEIFTSPNFGRSNYAIFRWSFQHFENVDLILIFFNLFLKKFCPCEATRLFTYLIKVPIHDYIIVKSFHKKKWLVIIQWNSFCSSPFKYKYITTTSGDSGSDRCGDSCLIEKLEKKNHLFFWRWYNFEDSAAYRNQTLSNVKISS